MNPKEVHSFNYVALLVHIAKQKFKGAIFYFILFYNSIPSS